VDTHSELGTQTLNLSASILQGHGAFTDGILGLRETILRAGLGRGKSVDLRLRGGDLLPEDLLLLLCTRDALLRGTLFAFGDRPRVLVRVLEDGNALLEVLYLLAQALVVDFGSGDSLARRRRGRLGTGAGAELFLQRSKPVFELVPLSIGLAEALFVQCDCFLYRLVSVQFLR
jgi:hypothetical protein